MTTISGNVSALSSLASLYAAENAKTDTGTGDTGTLSSTQVSSLVGIAEGNSSTGAGSLATLLGQSSTTGTTSSSDLSSIIDAIQAQQTSASAGATTGTTAATTASTDQQKAAAMMQSIYATQQANLFTLLG